MESDETEKADPSKADPPKADPPPEPVKPKSRVFKLVLLVAGLGIAAYLGKMGPREQHVNIVLGDQRWTVKAIDLQYVSSDGEVAREVHLTYGESAPRVIAHAPQLSDGTYRLKIDVDTRGGRRAVERQVTLGGGSTQVDISSALLPEDRKAP